MAILDSDPRADGLRVTPSQSPLANLNGTFQIVDKFGTYPTMYQEDEYVWRYTTLDINERGLAAVGYYLTPEVQIYDLSQPSSPLSEAISLTHPEFSAPDEPLPMQMPMNELQEQAIDLSFVWHTFMLSNGTFIHAFNNRTKAFYDDLDEEERHHYATIGSIHSDTQHHLELPGRIFARDEKDRLYVELNHVPDEREIGIYEVNWPQ